MRTLRIAQTIYLLLGMALCAGGAFSTYLMVRCSSINAEYTGVIHREIAQAQQVRLLQVNFKKQVQAWKDILLRGKDDAALAKYDHEFHALASQAQSDSVLLASQVKDEQAQAGLEEFAQTHQTLDSQYEAALAAYKESRDFAAADTMVKGKDRPPTDALDLVAARLTALAETVPAEVAARQQHEQTILIAVLSILWLALVLWSVAFARSLAARLAGCVHFVRAISGGDLTVVAPEERRSDELGILIEAMGEMRDRLGEMVGSIQSVSARLSGDAHDVSSSSSRIARAVSEERAEVSQVAAALEEMIATVREVTQHCHEAAVKAAQTGELAAGSSQAVENVAGEVRELASAAQSNASLVLDLGESSSRIGQIITLIEEIAGQTNLLALNAAIESARAGEHGRGFAVVAGEVRRLAERTTAATKEIAEAVQSIQRGTRETVGSIAHSSQRVSNSVITADDAARSLHVLGVSTSEVRQRIDQIAQATEEQSKASAQVGESMNGISASISSSSEGAEEAARIAEGLVQLARELTGHTSRFTTA
jgi:methyl-accepting chemotaxis protein